MSLQHTFCQSKNFIYYYASTNQSKEIAATYMSNTHVNLTIKKNIVAYLKVYDNPKNVAVSSTKSRHPKQIVTMACAKIPVM